MPAPRKTAKTVVAVKTETELALKRLMSRETKSSPTASHLIIEALAGTGKTTTLIEGLKFAKGLATKVQPSDQQRVIWEAVHKLASKAQSVGFVCFNKSIATELQSRVPAGCAAMTLHSHGFRAVTAAFGRVRVSEYRVNDLIGKVLDKDPKELWKAKPTLITATQDLVALCKQTLLLAPTDEDLDDLTSYYDIELNGSRNEVYDLVPKVLKACLDVNADREIDFNDMIWLPVALGLPVTKYDVLFVDEAQDLNRCQQELASMSAKRLVLVGDRNQAIYGFAGADVRSIDRMEETLSATEANCIVLPLTKTYRCGKAIVALAKTLVPAFEAAETNGPGYVGEYRFEDEAENCYTKFVKDGDMVLCRVNAPLVSQCFRFLAAGKKACILGRDIGKGLITTIRKLKADNVADLLMKLSDWAEAEGRKEAAKKRPSEAKLIMVEDRKACLEVFCEAARTIDDIIAKIESIFQDSSRSGVVFSSIHKAKGKEAKNVYLLQLAGACVPHPMAKSEWQREQENNLHYVAITRGIESFSYVRGKFEKK